MENLLKKIEILREEVLETWKLLDIDRKKSKVKSQKLEVSKSDFWNDHEKAVLISKGIDEKEKEIEEWENLRSEIRSLEELVAMSEEEDDDSLSIEKKEKELIIKALRKNSNKRKYAAQDLGISERTLYRKIKQYEIDD